MTSAFEDEDGGHMDDSGEEGLEFEGEEVDDFDDDDVGADGEVG